MLFLKKILKKKYTISIQKSLMVRQQLLRQKTNNSFSNRLKTFLSVFSLIITLFKRLQKTTATHLIIDNFIADHQIHLRSDFIRFFNKSIPVSAMVLANHKRFFYQKWTPKIALQCLKIWLQYSGITFLNLFVKEKNPTNYYYYVAANLLNTTLIQPQKIYIFQSYDTSAYLTALLLQEQHNAVYMSIANSVIYAMNRYTHLDKTTLILCNKYQIEETKNYLDRGWFKLKKMELWGPEEILEHNAVLVQVPTIDIGIYSRGEWARKGLLREKDINLIKGYAHSNNPYYLNFLDIVKAVIELKKTYPLSAKIYTHPIERTWYNEHGIRPPYWAEATENGIEIDLTEGNSLSKMYEVQMGIGPMSTVLLDRWHHDLKSLILYDVVIEKYYHKPSFFGSYSDNFYQNYEELKGLIIKKLALEER